MISAIFCRFAFDLVYCHAHQAVLNSIGDERYSIYRDSVRYMTTGFLPLAESGQLDLSRMTQNQVNQWNQPYIFQLKAKPVS